MSHRSFRVVAVKVSKVLRRELLSVECCKVAGRGRVILHGGSRSDFDLSVVTLGRCVAGFGEIDDDWLVLGFEIGDVIDIGRLTSL